MQVRARKAEVHVRPPLQKTLETARARFHEPEHSTSVIAIPNATLFKLNASHHLAVSTARLKSSVIIPFKDTPYLIEVSVTRSWEGGKIDSQPREEWEIEGYGAHWDEAINCVSTSETGRKDWGEDLRNGWTGRDQSLEARFGAFLRVMLEMQVILESFEPRTRHEERHEGGDT